MDSMNTGQTTDRELPAFPISITTEPSSWPESDELANRWATLNEEDLSTAIGYLSIEEIRAAFPFLQGVAREHFRRYEMLSALEENIRQAVTATAGYSAVVTSSTAVR